MQRVRYPGKKLHQPLGRGRSPISPFLGRQAGIIQNFLVSVNRFENLDQVSFTEITSGNK